MLRDTQKKISQFLLSLFILSIVIVTIPLQADLSSLAKNDALPMFTTLNFDDAVMLTKTQLEYKNIDWAKKKRSHVSLSISPFTQNADRGKTIKGQLTDFVTPAGVTITDTPLGDLTGRTGMIALLYGNTPTTATNRTTLAPTLITASNELFPGGDGLNDEGNIDPGQQFGYFSFPLKYRKRGIRGELTAIFPYNIGIRIQAGMSNIRQVREATINLTTDPEPDGFVPVSDITAPEVNEFLMNQFKVIADEIGINTSDFYITSMEIVCFNLFWRQAFAMNQDDDNNWARFLMIPYIQASGAISPSKKEDGHHFFGADFGNNGHPSAGFTAGFNLDFQETIEIGAEVGYTHFFKKSFSNMPIPNNEFQTNMFPFATNVSIHPGDNWHFGARIAAYHFLDNLSMYFEWFVLDHHKDTIKLDTSDPNFLPEVLAKRTTFKTKLGNASFNYDISPNIGLGFLWQIPFSQRNSYRSSTLMVGLNVTF